MRARQSWKPQPKHFTVTKVLPGGEGNIEFSGVVHNNDAQQYEIRQMILFVKGDGGTIIEDRTDFHHEDIVELLEEWLASDEAKLYNHPLKDAA